jgi:hypothetical protein
MHCPGILERRSLLILKWHLLVDGNSIGLDVR